MKTYSVEESEDDFDDYPSSIPKFTKRKDRFETPVIRSTNSLVMESKIINSMD